jgi:DNA phosphorothioation-dependent restriction protein DptH
VSLPRALVEAIGVSISAAMERAAVGHCVRLDNLEREDAFALCTALTQSKTSFRAAILGDDRSTSYAISAEEAVEIRNRKATRLCLLVPGDLAESSTSSLGNAFAVFDLDSELRRFAASSLENLPDEIRDIAKAATVAQRGPTRPTAEDIASYLAAIAEDPVLDRLGAELWRIGLVPDLGADGPLSRLGENARCARLIARPSRPQMSADERLDEIGLHQGAFRDDLLSFLQGRSLRDWKSWLRELSEPGRRDLSFHRWPLETDEPSNLESIELSPFLAVDGSLERWTNLTQPSGPGTEPMVMVGPRSKVTVKWKSAPRHPAGLARWRLRVVPSTDEHPLEDPTAVDLPEGTVTASRKSGSVALDLDLDAVDVRAVRVQVVALDEFQSEIKGLDGIRVEGLSDEFWLDDRGVTQSIEETTRRETVSNLPLGRLRAAVELRSDSLEAGPGTWAERDLAYFSVTLNGRRASAIATSPILRAFEQKVLAGSGDLAAYRASLSATQLLDPDWGIEPIPLPGIKSLRSFDPFAARRREIFRAIRGSDGTGLVETLAWTTELTAKVRSYARSYRELLAEARDTEHDTEPLLIDTLHLGIETGTQVDEAVVVLPTHPLRLLWYAGYAELLASWEPALLSAGAQRRNLLDLSLLERVAPLNVPAFVPHGRRVFPFTGNLRFFWGVATPVEAADAGRLAADVARCLGLPDAEVSLADLPPSTVNREIRSYLDLHPYVRSLRLRVENVGSGAFVAETLRQLYTEEFDEDEASGRPTPRLELTAVAHEPVPADLEPLAALSSDVYTGRPPGQHSHLHPFFSYSLKGFGLRPVDSEPHENLTVSIDRLAPTVEAVSDEDGDSASFYGLLVRLWPTYRSTAEGARWVNKVDLPSRSTRQRHPTSPGLTDELADVHREMLLTQAKLLGGSDGSVPAVVATVGPEERGEIDEMHALSDWVISLDRFLGPELFDDPGDPDMARVARTFLLDYGPEFLEGLGHRLMVTTSQREEVLAVLTKAMHDLGFGLVEQSVGDVLAYLKTVSGRLALRVIGDDSHAREAVSLGVVAAYLRASGELDDAILIPVDSHPELFGPAARRDKEPRVRCDLLRVRFARGRMDVAFIEVKSRSAAAQSEELMNRIVDQIEATEDVVRDLFFRRDPPRLDRTLQRSRLATILRFYLARARRYGLVGNEATFRELSSSIDRLEAGIPEMRAERLGFVVNLFGSPQAPVRLRDTTIRFLTAEDLAPAGFASAVPESTSHPPGDTTQRPAPSTPPSGNQRKPDEVTTSVDAGAAVKPGIEQPRLSDVSLTDAEPPKILDSELPDHDAELPSGDPGAPDSSPIRVRVALGESVGDGDVVAWTPSVRGSPHLFIVGIPGQGKSWTIARLLRRLHDEHLPALVFDFHGQFTDEGGLATGRGLSVVDAHQGLPFSPFETEANGTGPIDAWKTGSFAIAEILQYVCDLGDIQRDLVYQAIRDSYRALGYGDHVAGHGLPTVDDVRERLESLEQERGVRNVVARCRPVLDFGLFRESPSGPLFDDIVRAGAIVDVHTLALETLQLAAGAFVLRRVYKQMFAWGESKELRLAIVLDEAHRLARDVTLPKLMKEGRKFGILVIVASQGLADYHPDVVGNAGTKIVFRTNFPMSKRVAGFLRARKGIDLAAIVEQLDVGEAYVQTPEMATAARVRMYSLSEQMETRDGTPTA